MDEELTPAEIVALLGDENCLADEALREWLAEDARQYDELIVKLAESERRRLEELRARVAERRAESENAQGAGG